MKELIQRIKSDDVSAVEELYKQVYAKGIKIAASYVGKEGLEEDMLHEAFLKAVGNLDKFDESRPFQAWFDVILANTCKSYLRRKKPELLAEHAEEDMEPDEAFGELSTIGNPEEVLDQEELRQIIKKLLDELSEEQREAVILYYYQSMPVAQIAEHQNCSQETVKSRLFQARNKLKTAVEAYEKKTNTKLHSLGIGVALFVFFKSDMGKSYACKMGSGALKNVMAGGKTMVKSATMKLSTKLLIGAISLGVIGGAVAFGVSRTGQNAARENQVVTSSVVEGNTGTNGAEGDTASAATPEPTVEPTPEPTPTPTEVTPRTYSSCVFSDGEYITGSFPTIDGEFPDTSKTIAEIFFYIPEGKTLTYEMLCENMPPLLNDYYLPGGVNWDYPTHSNGTGSDCAGNYYLLSDENTQFSQEDNWEGYFGHGMSKEEWNSIFTLTRTRQSDGEYSWWANVVDIKKSEEELIELFMELINNYSYDQIYEMFSKENLDRNAGEYYKDWSTASDDYKKYIYFVDSFMFRQFITEETNTAYEAFKTDATGWVDFDAYGEDWDALTDSARESYGHYSFYFIEQYSKEFLTK